MYNLVLAAGHFEQVITELGLYRPVYYIYGTVKHNFIKLLDHLATAEFTQVAARLAGRTAGMFPSTRMCLAFALAMMCS